MNCKVRIASVLGVILLVMPALHAATCSNASIAGKWAFTSNGTLLTPAGPLPVAAVGNFSVDGSGYVTGRQTRSLAGQVAEETFSGTLPLNADCTGEETVQVYINGSVARTTTLHVVIDDNSRSARAIFTSLTLPDGTALPSIITLEAKRLFPRD